MRKIQHCWKSNPSLSTPSFHQFQILSNSTLELLKFHFPPISSSSSFIFSPPLKRHFLPNTPSTIRKFLYAFTSSSSTFFFFFLPQFSFAPFLQPLSPTLSPITILRTRTYARWIVILWRPGFSRALLTPHRIYTIFRISTLGHFAD